MHVWQYSSKERGGVVYSKQVAVVKAVVNAVVKDVLNVLALMRLSFKSAQPGLPMSFDACAA